MIYNFVTKRPWNKPHTFLLWRRAIVSFPVLKQNVTLYNVHWEAETCRIWYLAK